MEEVFNDGIYECIVVATNVEKYKVTSKVTVILQIRDDISATELKNTNKIYAGYRLKLEYWQKKVSHTFNISNFQYLCYACGLPEGVEINGINGLNDWLIGRQIRVMQHAEYSDYFRMRVNNIATWKVYPTQYPNTELTRKYRTSLGLETD